MYMYDIYIYIGTSFFLYINIHMYMYDIYIYIGTSFFYITHNWCSASVMYMNYRVSNVYER